MNKVIKGRGISKEDNELADAIMGGEMRNAWQPTERGEGVDSRPKSRVLRINNAFRDGYEKIYGKRNLFSNLASEE